MTVYGPLASARVFAILVILMLSGCSARKNQINPNLSSEMPQRVVWAWERPEDLRFLDPKNFGVAFLAQTIFLEKDGITPRLRRQPLDVAPGTYLIAVTRIESDKDGTKRPSFDGEMVGKVATLVRATLDLPDVKAIQIDFDAVVSERSFYRKVMTALRSELDKAVANTDDRVRIPLTMTSLASWCTGDAWFNDFPVDEAVPMVFQMGADSDKIKTYLRNGNDWNEPLCRGSYGISLEEGNFEGTKPGRRMYYFKNSAWKAEDINALTRR